MFVRASVNDDVASVEIVGPSNAVFVDIAGNDATGQRGNAAFPFLTVQAAMNAMLTGDEMFLSPGTFSAAVTVPAALVNFSMHGAGELAAGSTILTSAVNGDNLTLNPTNRNVLIDNTRFVSTGAGRGIVGTGTAQLGAFLSGALKLKNVDIVSASDALNLAEANQIVLHNVQTAASCTFTTCSDIRLRGETTLGAVAHSWDNTDAAKPAAQTVGLKLFAGATIGAWTGAGQAMINADPGSTIASMTGATLSVAAGPVSPSITVAGTVTGAVDFQSALAKRLPSSVLGSFTVSFAGAVLGGNFSVAVASGASRQIVSLVGARASGITITSDALCDTNARGAAFSTPTYATANTGALGAGTLIPPFLAITGLNIAAGGAIAFTFAATAGLTTAGSATFMAVPSQTNVGGLDLAVTAKSTTGFSIQSTAQAGNTADIYIVWP